MLQQQTGRMPRVPDLICGKSLARRAPKSRLPSGWNPYWLMIAASIFDSTARTIANAGNLLHATASARSKHRHLSPLVWATQRTPAKCQASTGLAVSIAIASARIEAILECRQALCSRCPRFHCQSLRRDIQRITDSSRIHRFATPFASFRHPQSMVYVQLTLTSEGANFDETSK
jgi:hypothetical protein